MRDTQIFAANSSSSIGSVIFLPHTLFLYEGRIVMFLLTFAHAVPDSDRDTLSSMLQSLRQLSSSDYADNRTYGPAHRVVDSHHSALAQLRYHISCIG